MPLAGYILHFLLRYHCLPKGKLLQTNQKTLKSTSSRGACSLHKAVLIHSALNTVVNTHVFTRDLAMNGKKLQSVNHTGFISASPKHINPHLSAKNVEKHEIFYKVRQNQDNKIKNFKNHKIIIDNHTAI